MIVVSAFHLLILILKEKSCHCHITTTSCLHEDDTILFWSQFQLFIAFAFHSITVFTVILSLFNIIAVILDCWQLNGESENAI